MLKQLRTSLLMFAGMTLITGLAYPLIITIAAQTLCSKESQGSLIVHDGRIFGSELIGQSFDNPKYFWGRPSATSPVPYNAGSSSGSNLSVGNPDQLAAVAQRVAALQKADPGDTKPVPADLVTASGSGLDPHISPAAAKYQIARVARLRHMSEADVARIVEHHTSDRQWLLLGQPRVNVLRLNIELDHPDWRDIPHSWKDPL